MVERSRTNMHGPDTNTREVTSARIYAVKNLRSGAPFSGAKFPVPPSSLPLVQRQPASSVRNFDTDRHDGCEHRVSLVGGSTLQTTTKFRVKFCELL